MNISPRSVTVLGTHDWRKTSQNLSETIQRINSGNKILGPADDARGIAEAEKIQSHQSRLTTANKAIDGGISYVQAGQGYLNELHSSLGRMSEIATHANSQMLGSGERAAYGYEFNQLAEQLVDILGSDTAQRFDIVNGFQPNETFTVKINDKEFTHTAQKDDSVKTIRDALVTQINKDPDASLLVRAYEGDDDSLLLTSIDSTQAITYESSSTGTNAVINQGTVAGRPGGMFNGMELFAEKAGNGPEIFVGELESHTYELPEAYLRIATNLIRLSGRSFDFNSQDLDTNELVQIIKGAQDEASSTLGEMAGAEHALSRFKTSNEITLQNLESALSRFMDADIAEESSKMAKFNILSQSAVAMLAQANFGPQNVLSLLK